MQARQQLQQRLSSARCACTEPRCAAVPVSCSLCTCAWTSTNAVFLRASRKVSLPMNRKALVQPRGIHDTAPAFINNVVTELWGHCSAAPGATCYLLPGDAPKAKAWLCRRRRRQHERSTRGTKDERRAVAGCCRDTLLVIA